MMDFVPIESVADVDLGHHALIEASAGTGKTYTIENLVVRLLKEDADIQLDNILLVTFTEKATGELKQRIRQKIEQALDDEPLMPQNIREKLTGALAGFDNAAIHTIHGFCHTLLKTFPFETGNLFEQEVVDDAQLMEKLLRSQMRREWPRRYGKRLEILLALSTFSADPDGFVRTTVGLTQQLSGDPSREQVIPDPDLLDIDVLWPAAREAVLSLKALIESPPRFSNAYGRLNINARSRSAIIRDVVRPIEETTAAIDPQGDCIGDMAPLMAMLASRHPSGDSNLNRLIPVKWLKAGENLHECPELLPVKTILDRLMGIYSRLSHLLMLTSIDRLRADTASTKAQHGWISYGDMLSRVVDFMDGEGAATGIRAIRQRYRVAFVDEFQDTDVLQWRIFGRLFLDNDGGEPRNRLFLIGDPKQAIYSFRGADVFTYLAARRRMTRLAGRGKANLYHLSTNWRSLPLLVEGFNRLFSQAAWFGGVRAGDPFAIGYTAVGSPPVDRLPDGLLNDASGRPPVNIVDLRPAETHRAAKLSLAGFICREIGRLVDAGGIRIAEAGRRRALDFRDIAILVRSQAEFADLEPQLNAAGIPYTYYRKPGLFQSREAQWLGMVLRAVIQPHNSAAVNLALLTPFFDIAAADLHRCPELPERHAAMRMLAHWHRLGRRRQWGVLFQSLLEGSGLTFRHCTDPGWDRMETNFHQLVDYLGAAAHTRNLDAGGMLSLLDGLRLASTAVDPDADIHQIDGDGHKVRVVTMHVSKGLEFPVVFIAGGLTQRNDDTVHRYHVCDPDRPERGCRRVIDLTAGSDPEATQQEIEDENKRLYYVALTRAKLKLYIPYYPDTRNHKWLGPICRFVAQSIDQGLLDGPVADRCVAWHTANDLPVGAIVPRDRFARRPDSGIGLPSPPLLPRQDDFRHRRLSLESFSSLGARIHPPSAMYGTASPFAMHAQVLREDDEPALSAPLASAGDADPLPGGPQVGSAFHHILENIDFQSVLDGPPDLLDDHVIRRIVVSALARYRIDLQWRHAMARRIADTLRTPLTIDGRHLILGELTPTQRRHEIEFFFPLAQRLHPHVSLPTIGAAGGLAGQMMIRGFIDLIFRWHGRYYIADWKSNRLADGYGPPALAAEMRTAGYELQYQLYAVATLRWLARQLGGRFDPLTDFGGAIYVFLRGVAAGDNQGIYHIKADRLLPVDALQAAIEDRIGAIQW